MFQNIQSQYVEEIIASFFENFDEVKQKFKELPNDLKEYFLKSRQNISPSEFRKLLLKQEKYNKETHLKLYRYGILNKAFESFSKTRGSNEEEILRSLKNLSPTYGVTPIELLAVTLYINKEAELKKATINKPHIASFGTGGDDKRKTNKTINITTISTLLAASFLEAENFMKYKVVKVSSRAVTSNFGGADTGENLSKVIKFPKLFKLVTLGDIGFPYNSELVSARKRLDETYRDNIKVIDPYKILYPSASITSAQEIITGTRIDLLPDISRLTKYLSNRKTFNRRVLYGSVSGNDELMPGNNFLINHPQGTKLAILLPELNEKDTLFIREKFELEEQIGSILTVIGLKGTISGDLRNLFAWNSAAQLPYEFITNNGKISYEVGLRIKSTKIFGYIENLQKGKDVRFALIC